MLTYNNNHIFTGYIKELLANFDLPKYSIYKQGMPLTEVIPSEFLTDIPSASGHYWYFPYLYNGDIKYYVNNKWVSISDNVKVQQAATLQEPKFFIGKRTNYTKRYIITNNLYDTYTHEYLGEYLRFKRDYEGIDLMPLYNCFSNNICLDAYFSFNIKTEHKNTDPTLTKVTISTQDSGYRIYMVPVKLFKTYTIAIDSKLGAEMCCGFFNQYQTTNTNLNTNFYPHTYKKFNTLSFSNPVLYDKLTITENIGTIAEPNNINRPLNDLIKASKESGSATNFLAELDTLKLFIKVPIDLDSSIVVLEGDYTTNNNIT